MQDSKGKIVPLKGPLLRIERANEHIAELETIFSPFIKGDFTTLIEESHSDGLHKILKLRLGQTLPDRAFILVGDACNSLRSALDQIAVALARQNGATDTSDVYFPVAGSAEDFERSGTQRKISKISADAIALIKTLKPYKGGNDDLWSLNKLRVKDFHENLIAVAADAMPLMEQHDSPFDWRRSMNGETFRFGGFPWDFANNGMDVAIYPKDVDMNNKVSVSLDIVFREPDTLSGLPVVRKLYDFRNLVERVALTFRDRFFR